MKELIIFDCDGVLVDSEQLGAQVFSKVLNMFQIDLDVHACYQLFKGCSLKDCFALLENKFQTRLPDEFKSVLDTETQKAFAEDLRPIAGIEPVIQYLKSTSVKLCVASNGGMEKIHHSLKTTGLADYFDENIFSAEQVENGKPAPDLFLFAANKMQVQADRCCVIEDSYAGLSAACAAKMDVVFLNLAAQDLHSQNELNVKLEKLIEAHPRIQVCDSSLALLEYFKLAYTRC